MELSDFLLDPRLNLGLRRGKALRIDLLRLFLESEQGIQRIQCALPVALDLAAGQQQCVFLGPHRETIDQFLAELEHGICDGFGVLSRKGADFEGRQARGLIEMNRGHSKPVVPQVFVADGSLTVGWLETGEPIGRRIGIHRSQVNAGGQIFNHLQARHVIIQDKHVRGRTGGATPQPQK